MAAQPAENNTPQALIDRIEASRARLGRHVAAARRKLDLPAQIKSSLRNSALRHPWALFGGTAGLGFLASRVLRRPKKAKAAKAGLIGSLLIGSFSLLKPFLIRLARQELERRFLSDRLPSQFQANSPRQPR